MKLFSSLKKPGACLILLSLSASGARAAFEDTGVGARAPGMADAFVAVADDANALFYNPAGLGQLTEGQLYADYGQPFSGTNTDNSVASNNYAAIAQPLHQHQWGTLAALFNSFQISNLYQERTIAVGYGKKLNIDFDRDSTQWLVGASVKQLHVGFDSTAFTSNGLNSAGFSSGQADPVFANHGLSSDAWAFDAGTLYRFGEDGQFGAGLDVANVNRPDISVSGSGDKPPFFTRAGASWRSPWALFSMELRRIEILTDQTDYEGAFGVEKSFPLGRLGAFDVRAGYGQGTRQYQLATAGASYELSFLRFDYAFDFPIGTLGSSAQCYYAGLSIKWGGPPSAPKRLEPGPEKKKEGPVPVAAAAPRQNLVQDYEANQRALDEKVLQQRLAQQLQETPQQIEESARQARLRAEIQKAQQEIIGLENLIADKKVSAVHFEYGGSSIFYDSRPTVDQVAGIMSRYPTLRLRINGYTDSKGGDARNLALSQERAQSVKHYLVSRGMPESAITTAGYGKARPVASNDSDEGREINRRVEFVFYAPAPHTYTVQEWDTLDKIARLFYGDPEKASDIYKANKSKIHDQDHLTAGQELVLP